MGEQPLATNTMQQTRHSRHASKAPEREFLAATLIFAGLLAVMFVPTVVFGAIVGVVGLDVLSRLRERASTAGTERKTERTSGTRPTA